MSDDSGYIEYVLELLAPLGPVRARKMFGGYGLYHDALMFALVAEQQLFLKIDEHTEAQFAAAGSAPFVYQSATKTVAMRYWSAPEAALDSPNEMLPWAQLAFSAARRALIAKSNRPTRKPRSNKR